MTTRELVRLRVAAPEFLGAIGRLGGAGTVMVGVAEPARSLGYHAKSIIAALPAAAIRARDQPREATAAKNELPFVIDAILAIRAGIAFLIGQAKKRIDTTLVAITKVSRAFALLQSRRTDARAILAEMVPRAGRGTGVWHALTAAARLPIAA